METPAYEFLPLEILDLLLSLVPWQLPFLWRTSQWWRTAVEWFGKRTGREVKKIHPRGVMNSFSLVDWSLFHLPFNPRLLDHAARWGTLEVVKSLSATGNWNLTHFTLLSAVGGDHPKTLEFLLEKFRDSKLQFHLDLNELALEAVKKDASHSLCWLFLQNHHFQLLSLFARAASHGSLRSMKLLQERCREKIYPKSPVFAHYTELAVRGGSLPALLWLEKKGYPLRTQHLLFVAITMGSEEVFSYLFQKTKASRSILLGATRGESDLILKQVLQQVKPGRRLLQTLVEERRLSALETILEVYPSELELVLWLSVDLNRKNILELCLSLGGVVSEELLFLAVSLNRRELFPPLGPLPYSLAPFAIVRPWIEKFFPHGN